MRNAIQKRLTPDVIHVVTLLLPICLSSALMQPDKKKTRASLFEMLAMSLNADPKKSTPSPLPLS